MKQGAGRRWLGVELGVRPGGSPEPGLLMEVPHVGGIEQSKEPCSSTLGILCTGSCPGPFLISPD